MPYHVGGFQMWHNGVSLHQPVRETTCLVLAWSFTWPLPCSCRDPREFPMVLLFALSPHHRGGRGVQPEAAMQWHHGFAVGFDFESPAGMPDRAALSPSIVGVH